MSRKEKGSMTIFLAMVMLLFLTFALVLTEGARIWYLRVKARQAMELAEFSVLSEYQQELFEHYGLFFLDLDYEQGMEQTGILEQRAQTYLTKNAEELTTKGLWIDKFCRATDDEGAVFFHQVTECMKIKSGYHILEELIGKADHVTLEEIDLQKVLTQHGGISVEDVSLPSVSFPSENELMEAVFGSDEGLSSKEINLGERILQRSNSRGIGKAQGNSFADMQFFYGYLFEYCNYYGAKKPNVWKEALEYQLEYIISGEESDKKNLKEIAWRIFLLRAGGDYLFYHQDAAISGKARAQAVALVGHLGNVVLVEAVKELFLIVQAIEDGIAETRQVFAGEKVPLYQKGAFGGIQFGYEEYLYLFLKTTDRTEKIYRTMDIVELEVRKESGYEKLRLDHCVEAMEIQWIYQFPSLFLEIPLKQGGIYENTITRKIYYEI